MQRLTGLLSQLLIQAIAPFSWLGKQLLFSLINTYQYLLSPWIGNQCRFHPTCSHYALEAINRFGVIKGGYLMIVRLLKCSPWHEGGFDPVPLGKESSSGDTKKQLSDKKPEKNPRDKKACCGCSKQNS